MRTATKSTNIEMEQTSALDESTIRCQVDRILNSPVFLSSHRLSDFFRYVSEKSINGEAAHIKQFTIGIDVYGRKPDFDPKTDPIIRIEAGRLRRKLKKYYDKLGKFDPVYVEIPRGNYVPIFRLGPQSVDQDIAVENPEPKRVHTLASPVVAVFPFVCSEDDENEYLVVGLGTELVDGLSQTPDLQVLAYYTTAQFNNGPLDLPEISDSLGIDFAVTGTIRVIGDNLRINVQLIDARSGKQMWCHRFNFERDFSSIEELEQEIVSNVLGRIADQSGIIVREMSNRLSMENNNPSIYEAILRGHNYLFALTPESFQQARTALEKAVEVEPDSATAWAMLSVIYLDSVIFEYAEIPDGYQLGIKYASIATSKDPSSQIAHNARAYVGMLERDRSAMEHSARRMISINENAASMIATAGFWLCLAGLYDEGMKWFNRGIKLNPSYPDWLNAAPYFCHMQAGEYELSLQHANDFGMPDFSWSPLMKASALGLLGRFEEAARSYSCLLELKPDFEENPRSFISSFILEESLMDTVLQGLQAAGMAESADLSVAPELSRYTI